MATFPKKTEAKSILGETFSPYKKSGTFGSKYDLKDVECYKWYKKGHYRNKFPESKDKDTKGPLKVRKVRLSPRRMSRQSLFVKSEFYFLTKDSETKDPFMRFWVIQSNLGQEMVGPDNETLVSQGLECVVHLGPTEGFNINLK